MLKIFSKNTRRNLKHGLFDKYTDVISLVLFFIAVVIFVRDDLMSTSYEVTTQSKAFFGAENINNEYMGSINNNTSNNVYEGLENILSAAYNFDDEFIPYVPVHPPRIV